MNILFIGNFTGHPMHGAELPDEISVADAFEFYDHEVTRLQRDEMLSLFKKNQSLGGTTHDLIIVAKWHNLNSAIIEWLKSSGTPVIYWPFDLMVRNGKSPEWHLSTAMAADCMLSKDLFFEKGYKKMGINFQYLSLDSAADWFRPVWGVEPEFDLLFTGQPIEGERLDIIQRLLRHGYDLRIYGNKEQWAAYGIKAYDGVYDKDYGGLVAKAKASIAVDFEHVEGYWSNRIAKVMCCGGIVLTKYTTGMNKRFGDYVMYWKDYEELTGLIKVILNSPNFVKNERERVFNFADTHLRTRHVVGDLLDMYEKGKLGL
ncbi:hypothetical protein GW915_00075 [bacterium]|nr:hypothetical protein [bacterium]